MACREVRTGNARTAGCVEPIRAKTGFGPVRAASATPANAKVARPSRNPAMVMTTFTLTKIKMTEFMLNSISENLPERSPSAWATAAADAGFTNPLHRLH